MIRVLVVFGTRPEAVKMCPLVIELKKRNNVRTIVCLTGQHREMTRQVMDAFGIYEDYNLDVMKRSQTLVSVTSDILRRMDEVLCEVSPDIVLVHGDTTSSFAAALSAFYRKIPVGHVEAGLRTGNIYSPYPEEMNRCLTGRLATYHFAPTKNNSMNLENEGISKNVYITGNTVIDSLNTTVHEDYVFHNDRLRDIVSCDNRIILVTAHRRENWGVPLKNICSALARIVEMHSDVLIVYPVHPNPVVHDLVYDLIGGMKGIVLLEPLDVLDMHNLMAKCYMVMTDSGGLQEEAPHFGKPVLVLRTETERPEAVEAGTVNIVGVDEDVIVMEAMKLLNDRKEYARMSKKINPYGDGHASERIADVIESEFVET